MDDEKIHDMPDWLFRRFVLLLCAAKEHDKAGLLRPVSKLAWRLRLREEEIEEALRALSEIGVARETADGWLIVNFAKRQAVTPSAERMRRKRAKERHSDDNSDASPSSSASDSFNLNRKDIFSLYEEEIGTITKTISDTLLDAEKEYPFEWLESAFREASRHNARSWAYVESILKRWKTDGFRSDGRSYQDQAPIPTEVFT
jgi:DnaD/phage-associated family protein